MRVWFDPDKLTQYGLTPANVATAVGAYNVEVSAGQLGGAPTLPGQRMNASILVQSMLTTPRSSPTSPSEPMRMAPWSGEGHRPHRVGL